MSVAMCIEDDDKPIPMPDRIWKRLKSMLVARQVDLSQFVPVDQIKWMEADSMFVDKRSGKDAWVYTIDRITWRGTDRLYVSESVCHGNLAAGGSTLVLVKENGKWRIVGKTKEWVSKADGEPSRAARSAVARGRGDTWSEPRRSPFATERHR